MAVHNNDLETYWNNVKHHYGLPGGLKASLDVLFTADGKNGRPVAGLHAILNRDAATLGGPIQRKLNHIPSEYYEKAQLVVGSVYFVRNGSVAERPGYYVNSGHAKYAKLEMTKERRIAFNEGLNGKISGVDDTAQFSYKYRSMYWVQAVGGEFLCTCKESFCFRVRTQLHV